MSMSALGMPPPSRSTFVTVVAWIFIGIAGFTSIFALMESVVMQMVVLPLRQQNAFPTPLLPANMPVLSTWLFAHILWICGVAFFLALVMLIAAIGVLFRKEWARRLLIGFMVLGILYKCAATIMQWMVPLSTYANFPLPPHTPPETMATMQSFMSMMQPFIIAMRIFSIISAIVVSVLLGWIIHRLSSTRIRAEFQPAAFHLETQGHAP
jgi:hypothetical protein